MQDCVSAYSKTLNLHWTKAFGEGYIISKAEVKTKLVNGSNQLLEKSAFIAILREIKKWVQESI